MKVFFGILFLLGNILCISSIESSDDLFGVWISDDWIPNRSMFNDDAIVFFIGEEKGNVFVNFSNGPFVTPFCKVQIQCTVDGVCTGVEASSGRNFSFVKKGGKITFTSPPKIPPPGVTSKNKNWNATWFVKPNTIFSRNNALSFATKRLISQSICEYNGGKK